MADDAHLKLIPRHKYVARFARSAGIGLFLIYLALVMGMLGYHTFEKMSWVDSFVNAAMILSGMGPLGNLSTTAGKIFAGCYALFSGLFFILVVGIMFAPFAHRTFKRFRIEDEASGSSRR
jgi:hypothetical protein